MSAPTDDAGRLALLLVELRLPTIARLWPELAQLANKEGWPGTRFLGAAGTPSRRTGETAYRTPSQRIPSGSNQDLGNL
jgi:hypothetical protein